MLIGVLVQRVHVTVKLCTAENEGCGRGAHVHCACRGCQAEWVEKRPEDYAKEADQ